MKIKTEAEDVERLIYVAEMFGLGLNEKQAQSIFDDDNGYVAVQWACNPDDCDEHLQHYFNYKFKLDLPHPSHLTEEDLQMLHEKAKLAGWKIVPIPEE